MNRIAWGSLVIGLVLGYLLAGMLAKRKVTA
jgi:hypothetical protein